MTRSSKKYHAAKKLPPIFQKHAWLISWMGTRSWAGPENPRSIMAIIDGRHSERFVKKAMVLLDMRANCSAYWMAYFATRKRAYGLPTRIGPGLRMGGSDAFLYGRIVSELRITTDKTTETIEWVEPEYWANNPHTYQLELKERGQRHKVIRSIDEYIGAEPYHRW